MTCGERHTLIIATSIENCFGSGDGLALNSLRPFHEPMLTKTFDASRQYTVVRIYLILYYKLLANIHFFIINGCKCPLCGTISPNMKNAFKTCACVFMYAFCVMLNDVVCLCGFSRSALSILLVDRVVDSSCVRPCPGLGMNIMFLIENSDHG